MVNNFSTFVMNVASLIGFLIWKIGLNFFLFHYFTKIDTLF